MLSVSCNGVFLTEDVVPVENFHSIWRHTEGNYYPIWCYAACNLELEAMHYHTTRKMERSLGPAVSDMDDAPANDNILHTPG